MAKHPEPVIRHSYILGMHGHCFIEGTKVILGNGAKKNIENIQIGDSVMTYDFVNKRFVANPVIKVDSQVQSNLIKVFLDDIEITSTQDHPYYVKNKGLCSFNPKQAFQRYGILTKRLEVSDFCFIVNKGKLKKIKVNRLVPIKSSVRTYNLTKISNSNNYFVNGIMVNNESNMND